MTTAEIEIEELQDLLRILADEGYRVVGPTLREGAIVYDDLTSVDDLPRGWTDTQDGGLYRLQRRKDQALFGYAVGPHSWKKFLHPPVVRLWRAKREDEGFTVIEENDNPPKFAFIDFFQQALLTRPDVLFEMWGIV